MAVSSADLSVELAAIGAIVYSMIFRSLVF